MTYKKSKNIIKKSLTLLISTIFIINAAVKQSDAQKNSVFLTNAFGADIAANDNSAAKDAKTVSSSLYAKYAAVMDASNNRVLLGKNENVSVPMASTTKIMTCIIALENADASFKCTTSRYAASMPDVQLNAKTGESFILDDLLYSLMLKSHNDTAVIIAENTAYQYIYNNKDILSDDVLDTFSFVNLDAPDSTFLAKISAEQSKLLVSFFAGLMNEKALALGCENTYFITPNGLDGEDENGIHSTTARELCIIMSYCIKNPDFLKITQTASHSFNGYSVSNANAFLNMYPDIISGKTGFTGNAGYCYICAYEKDDRTFIVALLACGWPNNKTYKWHDARILLNWARQNFYPTEIVKNGYLSRNISVTGGEADTVHISSKDTLNMLLSQNEKVNITINIPESIAAPVTKGDTAGKLLVYINDNQYCEIPVYADENVIKTDFLYFLKYSINSYMFIDK